MKIGDVDARKDQALCYTISDKARCIGQGVMKAAEHMSASPVSGLSGGARSSSLMQTKAPGGYLRGSVNYSAQLT